MKQRRVLSVLHSFNNRGGTENHAKFLANLLQDTAATTFIAPQKDTVQIFDQTGALLRETPVPLLAYPETPFSQVEYRKCIETAIETFMPDVIHLHHLMNWPLEVIEIIRHSGIPWVMSVHDYYFITPHFTMQGITDPKVTLGPNYSRKIFGADISDYLKKRRDFLRQHIEEASKVVAPSKYMKRVFQAVFTKEVALVPHAIPAFEVPAETPAKAFGYIGSFLPQKGIILLLDAYKLYRTMGGSWQLHLYGGDLAVPTEEGVFAHGVYESKDLPSISSAFSVGIVPSIFPETFCLSLSELWQMQKPVIAFGIGALTERFRDAVNGGWLVEKIDANSLATQMYEVEALYTRTNTYEFCAEIPTVSSMTEQYQTIYNGLIG